MKKGEVTTAFIIGVIVVIASLVALIYPLSQLDAKGSAQRQACLTSVIARSQLNANVFGLRVTPGKDFIPLNCKTEKICISESGEECDASGFKKVGSNNPDKINVGLFDDTKEVVLETISEKLYDCHTMLGSGKYNFLPETKTSQKYCLVCSRIALDEEARESAGTDISYTQLYQYLQQKKTSQGQSYLKVIYGFDKAQDMNPLLEKIRGTVNEKTGKQTINSINDMKIDLSSKEGNAIIVQTATDGQWNEIISGGGWLLAVGAGAVAVLAAPISVPVTLGATVVGLGLAIISPAVKQVGDSVSSTDLTGADNFVLSSGPILYSDAPEGAVYAHPTLYAYNSTVLSALNCNSFEISN